MLWCFDIYHGTWMQPYLESVCFRRGLDRRKGANEESACMASRWRRGWVSDQWQDKGNRAAPEVGLRKHSRCQSHSPGPGLGLSLGGGDQVSLSGIPHCCKPLPDVEQPARESGREGRRVLYMHVCVFVFHSTVLFLLVFYSLEPIWNEFEDGMNF